MAEVLRLDQYRQAQPRQPEADVYEVGPGAYDLERLQRMYYESEDQTQDFRTEQALDCDYYDGHQWTDLEVEELRKRNQPPIVINRIRRKVNWLLGYEQKTRTDPRAWPRNPQDEERADVATKTLKFIGDDCDLDTVFSEAFSDLLKPGYCVTEVTVEQNPRGNPKICVYNHPWWTFFYDPRSRKADFEDARYMGLALWMDLDQAAERYPDKADDLESMLQDLSVDETYEDKPHRHWGDRARRRVLICQMHYIAGGQWHVCEFTGAGKLMETISPFLDENGEPECALIAQSLYVTRDLERVGVVRDMRGPQDEINHRRSKLLHQLNHRQTFGKKSALKSSASIQNAMARADGHVEINDGSEWGRDVGLVENGQQIQGQAELLQEAKMEIDVQGPNAGKQGREDLSGRSFIAQQQAGLSEENLAFDRLRDLKQRVWRACWRRAQQFWKQPDWIRVTDDDRAAFVAINQPVGMNPMTGEPIFENAVGDIDVDIIIEEAPNSPNVQFEQFQMLTQLVPSLMQLDPDPIAAKVWGQIMLEASALPNKRQLIEKLEAARQQAAQQGPNPMQMMHMQMEMEGKQAETEKRRADAAKQGAAAKLDQAKTFETMVNAMRPPEPPRTR